MISCPYCKKKYENELALQNHIVFIICGLNCCTQKPLCKVCAEEQFCLLYLKALDIDRLLNDK